MNFSPFSFLLRGKDALCQTAKRHLRQWTKPDNHALVLNAAVDLTRSKSELVLENTLLRQQVIRQALAAELGRGRLVKGGHRDDLELVEKRGRRGLHRSLNHTSVRTGHDVGHLRPSLLPELPDDRYTQAGWG